MKERAGGTQTASDRSFGFVFCGAFAVISGILWWKGSAYWPWTLGGSACFLLLALVRPRLLAPLNKAWMRFGRLLHSIVNPLIMAIIFYGTVTPTGLVMRLLGKDQLRLRFDPEATTYWIERKPPGPDPKTMRNVF